MLYLDTGVLDAGLAGAAVDRPGVDDPLLRHRIHQLHLALDAPGDELEAESRLTLIQDRLRWHFGRTAPQQPSADGVAGGLRELLDTRVRDGITLREAGALLDCHPGHLVRSFTATFGLPPHRYLVGRRVEQARRLLLDGRRPAEVAAEVGFHDQSHLHRHFVRHVGVTPARYAAQGGVPNRVPSAR